MLHFCAYAQDLSDEKREETVVSFTRRRFLRYHEKTREKKRNKKKFCDINSKTVVEYTETVSGHAKFKGKNFLCILH